MTGLQPDTTYHYRLIATNGAGGTSRGAWTARFRTAPPSVTGIAPHGGPDRDGSSSVTISGANFVGVTAVSFGSSDALSYVVESENSIHAVAPPGTGIADVAVLTSAGSSATGASDRFTYLLQGSGRTWGQDVADFGDGASANSDVPIEMSALPEVAALAAGGPNMALLKDGTVETWESNAEGNLGDGRTKGSDVPVKVCAPGVSECPNGPYLEEVAAISSGEFDGFALLKNGTVMAWGQELGGRAGLRLRRRLQQGAEARLQRRRRPMQTGALSQRSGVHLSRRLGQPRPAQERHGGGLGHELRWDARQWNDNRQRRPRRRLCAGPESAVQQTIWAK